MTTEKCASVTIDVDTQVTGVSRYVIDFGTCLCLKVAGVIVSEFQPACF